MEMQQTKRRKKNSYWRARTHTKPITSSADDGAYVYVCVFVCVCVLPPAASRVRTRARRRRSFENRKRQQPSVWLRVAVALLWGCGSKIYLKPASGDATRSARARERVVSVFIAQHYNHNDIHFRCASDPTLGRKVAGRDRGIQGTNLDFSHARSFIYIICN